ncbi:hypothetical protein B6U81_00455 [Thermoplasmatales archaeon ex4484_30]|nr:MAG: hypothetical protein B6U81_00455 [Thermoplasmatales archaeon ex4484_30]
MPLNTKKCYFFVNYWEKLQSSVKSVKKQPLRLLAIFALAIIIFSFLVVMVYFASPKENFQVECLQVNEKDGNLLTVASNEQVVPLTVVLEVKDSNNKSVEGAKVTLSGGDAKDTGKTNEDGIAKLFLNATFPTGQKTIPFTVKVEKKGFERYTKHNFVLVVRA